jgi:hypothetical protein
MSRVTNIILSMGTLEEHKERLQEVNKYFDEQEKRGLILMDEDKETSWEYGGSKGMECWIAMGGFNYLDLEEFKNHLKTIKWNSDLQLFSMGQDDDKWSLWEI